MTFRGRRFRVVLAVSWKAHLARRGTWILWRHWSWKCEGTIAWVVARIGRNQLMLMVVRLVLISSVPTIVWSYMPGACISGRCSRRS